MTRILALAAGDAGHAIVHRLGERFPAIRFGGVGDAIDEAWLDGVGCVVIAGVRELCDSLVDIAAFCERRSAPLVTAFLGVRELRVTAVRGGGLDDVRLEQARLEYAPSGYLPQHIRCAAFMIAAMIEDLPWGVGAGTVRILDLFENALSIVRVAADA